MAGYNDNSNPYQSEYDITKKNKKSANRFWERKAQIPNSERVIVLNKKACLFLKLFYFLTILGSTCSAENVSK